MTKTLRREKQLRLLSHPPSIFIISHETRHLSNRSFKRGIIVPASTHPHPACSPFCIQLSVRWSGFNRRPLERSINDRSTRARDGTLFPSVFRRRLQKNKMTTPDIYIYIYTTSTNPFHSWKRGTNKRKKDVSSRVFEESSHGLRSKIKKREVKVKETNNRGVIGSWTVSWLRGRGGIVKFRLEGLTQWELSFRNDLARLLSPCLSTSCTNVFLFAGVWMMGHERFVRVHHVWQEVKASKQSILLK